MIYVLTNRAPLNEMISELIHQQTEINSITIMTMYILIKLIIIFLFVTKVGQYLIINMENNPARTDGNETNHISDNKDAPNRIVP